MTNYRTGTREGERKRRREKGRTPTPTHLAQNGQTQKEQRRRKSRRTTGQTPTRGVGGGWKRLTQPTRREPNLPRHTKDPNLTWHGCIKRCIHQPVQRFVFRLKGPPISSQNPLDGLSGQPSNWCTIEPHQIHQKKVTTPERHVLKPEPWHVAIFQADHSPEQRCEDFWKLHIDAQS